VPSAEERNSDPLEFGYFLQDLMLRAQTAYQAENWPATVKYFEAMAIAVPDIARPHSTLCVAHAKLGNFDVARAFCWKATTLQGAKVIDHLRFVDLTLRRQKLDETNVVEIEESLKHLREHAAQHPQALPGDAPIQAAPTSMLNRVPETGNELLQKVLEERAARAGAGGAPAALPTPPAPDPSSKAMHLPTEIELRACKLAALTNNDVKLVACMEALRGYKVDERLLLPFAWARTLLHKDEARASELLEGARSLGLPAEVIGAMESDQARVFGRTRRLVMWLLGGLAVLGLVAFAVHRKLRSGQQSPSTAADAGQHSTEHSLGQADVDSQPQQTVAHHGVSQE
jgi:hypothetical protein